MKKINSLNTFLTALMIATSFFGIIRPQENLKLPHISANTQAIDLINAAHLNTPMRRFIKTAKSDFNDPQFWERSISGATISMLFLASFLVYNGPIKEVPPNVPLEIDLCKSPLVEAVLGSVLSTLPYLFKKNSLNSDNICHMANHVGVQLIALNLPKLFPNKVSLYSGGIPLFLKILLYYRARAYVANTKKQPTNPNSEGLHEEN